MRFRQPAWDNLFAVNSVLKRFEQRDNPREIYEDKWSVSEKIEQIVQVMTQHTKVRFSELFEDATSRSEVVCTFLALLELIRLKQLICAQSSDFGEIEIRKREVVGEISATPKSSSAVTETSAPAPADTPNA